MWVHKKIPSPLVGEGQGEGYVNLFLTSTIVTIVLILLCSSLYYLNLAVINFFCLPTYISQGNKIDYCIISNNVSKEDGFS